MSIAKKCHTFGKSLIIAVVLVNLVPFSALAKPLTKAQKIAAAKKAKALAAQKLTAPQPAAIAAPDAVTKAELQKALDEKATQIVSAVEATLKREREAAVAAAAAEAAKRAPAVAAKSESPALPAAGPQSAALPAAAAKVEPAAKAPKFDELTMAEIPGAFLNFQLVEENASTAGSKATFFGMVFDDCQGFFDIQNTSLNRDISTDSSAPNGSSIGFSIRDEDGKGRACMRKHKLAGDVCGKTAPLTCSRLSRVYPGATFDMTAEKDGTPRLCHLDPNNDLTPLICEDFSPALPKHLTLKTRRDLKLRAAIANNTRITETCRGNLDELAQAREAADKLLDLKVTQDVVDRIKKELDAAEKALIAKKTSDDLASLTSRVKKATIDDLESLREELGAYAKANPESGEKLAPLYHDIALKYVNRKNADGPSFQAASDTLAEAGELSGLKPQTQLRLENYQLDLAVGNVQTLGQYGVQNNYMFYPAYYSLMNDLQTKAMSSCSGPYASQEACASVMTASRAASQIPVKAQQIDQQRMQVQQQMQQAMGAGGMTMPMNGGMAGPSGGMGAGLGFGFGAQGRI